MATAKNAPKKPAVKKPVAKKAAPAKTPTRRGGRRKADPVATEEVLRQAVGNGAAEATAAAEQTPEQIELAALRDLVKVNREIEINEEKFAAIDAIDLREMPVAARFHLLENLSIQGFLAVGSYDQKPLIEDVHFVSRVLFENYSFVRMNHVNKLITPIFREQDLEDTDAISKVDIHAHVGVYFTEPVAKPPREIEIEGVKYVRQS